MGGAPFQRNDLEQWEQRAPGSGELVSAPTLNTISWGAAGRLPSIRFQDWGQAGAYPSMALRDIVETKVYLVTLRGEDSEVMPSGPMMSTIRR